MSFKKFFKESKNHTTSAGILLFTQNSLDAQVFLVKMGGPYFKNTERCWGIPKGHVEADETDLEAAFREFEEETGIELDREVPVADLGKIIYKNKTIRIFARRGEGTEKFKSSNEFQMEYPKGSGTQQSFPENETGAWFDIKEARKVIAKNQLDFIYMLDELSKFSD